MQNGDDKNESGIHLLKEKMKKARMIQNKFQQNKTPISDPIPFQTNILYLYKNF